MTTQPPVKAATSFALLFVAVVALFTALAVAATPPLGATDPDSTDNEVRWSTWLATELGGEAEHRLYTGRRVDVLLDSLAIEVEWAKGSKVHEAVEQAEYYGIATGRPGAIVVLVNGRSAEDKDVVSRVIETARSRGIVAVSIIDVQNPDVQQCKYYLGLVGDAATK